LLCFSRWWLVYKGLSGVRNVLRRRASPGVNATQRNREPKPPKKVISWRRSPIARHTGYVISAEKNEVIAPIEIPNVEADEPDEKDPSKIIKGQVVSRYEPWDHATVPHARHGSRTQVALQIERQEFIQSKIIDRVADEDDDLVFVEQKKKLVVEVGDAAWT
jgi:hypothetical protein